MLPNKCDLDKISKAYLTAKKFVIDKGYSEEVDWQDSICFNSYSHQSFLKEYAWVVLSSGLSTKVVSKVYPHISAIFKDWENLDYIENNKNFIRNSALEFFNNVNKINALIDTSIYVKQAGIKKICRQIQIKGLDYLQSFPFIGTTTCYHLAKNIGLSYAKPDRHLIRISHILGFENPKDLCKIISDYLEEKIQVVDIVLWRYATLDKNYQKRLKKLNEIIRTN